MNNPNLSNVESWSKFISVNGSLCILTDVDGTLIPFASSPDEATPLESTLSLLSELTHLPNVNVAVVSGRSRTYLDRYFSSVKKLHIVAEHGVWHRSDSDWQSKIDAPPTSMDQLVASLSEIVDRFYGALFERKTCSLALHYRRVKIGERDKYLSELRSVFEPWLRDHSSYEVLPGDQVLEIRPTSARKSTAIQWFREDLNLKGSILALGDDITDEDMFRALRPDDRGVIVNTGLSRPTAALWQLSSQERVLEFLRAIVAFRKNEIVLDPGACPVPVEDKNEARRHSLVVLSNRLPEARSQATDSPERKKNVGGLVSALKPVLEQRGGIWFGWNGETYIETEKISRGADHHNEPALAWLTFSTHWYENFYKGFCNGALWPLFHSFPGKTLFQVKDWEAYREVNQAFAASVSEIGREDSTVWVHDYHLLLTAKYLREQKHQGPIGFFLHIPFPGPDIYTLMPWSKEILTSLLDFDLLGFQTHSFVQNFRQCLLSLEGVKQTETGVHYHGRFIRLEAFPIGIIPENFQGELDPTVKEEMDRLVTSLKGQKLVLGVDRLDYTKGIPQRILAFGELLRIFPEWRRRVALIQISVPSRADIEEYETQRAQIEEVVGHINGEFGDADWTPIRYLYRSYDVEHLQQLYRIADVGYVTPLRDGMNLVAKEYIASQDSEKPGVLLLSQFAGAAEELSDAVLTNPWCTETMVQDLNQALHMPLAERKVRHEKLLARVMKTTAFSWAEDFLTTLEETK